MFKKLFGIGKEKAVEVQPEVKVAPVVKVESMAKVDNTVSLEKSVASLEKTLVNLSKKTGVSLDKHKAKVAVVLDYSGSMGGLYRDGKVQEVLNRLMPIALKFDDDGELDVWLFSNSYKRIDSMDINNYASYVKTVVDKSGYRMGGTSYAPVLEDVLEKYFTEEKDTSNIPTFVIYITDGANNDEKRTTEVVKRSADENIFIQFVGIGSTRFTYLEELDDLEDRAVDNTGFIKVSDMTSMSEGELYDLLLDQYPDWLKSRG